MVGHLTVLFDPLWQKLYGYQYLAVESATLIWGRLIPVFAVLGSSWVYALPALFLFYGQRREWWPRHYVTGVLAFIGLVVYHLVVHGAGESSQLWAHSAPAILAGRFPYLLFISILSALVSLLVVLVLISTRHYAITTLLPTLIAGIVAAPLLVYGILGAPFWLPLLLGKSATLISLGTLVTLGLALWVVHLACWGLHASRKQHLQWG